MENIQHKFDETAEATELRRLYHRIRTEYVKYRKKLFMVTSANVSEGKSTISSSLAITSALYRETKTLLIDCDLRRPTIHKLFKLPLENGLADFLSNKSELDKILKDTTFPSLKVITAGTSDQSPSRLISSFQLYDLFEMFRSYFEIIIVDAPPVIPTSDALFLGNGVDAILMVLKAGVTKKKVAKRAINSLADNKEKILGTVINNMKNVMPYSCDYSYYNYKKEKNDE
ncbi:MAG: polysaccharide biosynthesis tyrosine autokinase [Actinobacteria bacterium]|nr:polysaccharide biosynthesis tyrosine autokinase [Actinomycetota bacterium]